MHISPPRRRLAVFVALACSCSLAHAADVSDATDLETVKVTASSRSASVQREQQRLLSVAGGSNLVEPQTLARLATLRDALDFQPGIVVQDFFGGLDQPRLNIRGSGIQSNPLNRGVLLLRDGLPLNEADGSFVIGVLEPRNAAAVSVRRGANAISPGASTLGGELDFVSLTAADESRRFGIESGSFGRRGAQAGLGATGNRFDAHLGVSADHNDGYRHHSDGARQSLQANLGLPFGESGENRSYLDWTDLAFRIPTVVPKSRVESDPEGVMGDGNTPQDTLLNIYRRNPLRDTEQLRLANITRWGNDALTQQLGVYWQHSDDLFKDPAEHTVTDSRTRGAQWQLDGRRADIVYHLGLATASSDMARSFYANNPANGTRLQRFGAFDLDAVNHHAMAGLEWQASSRWSLLADLKWSHVERDAHRLDAPQALTQHWSYATPRIGAIWRPSPGQRLYANISRSHEAPTFWEIVSSSVSPAKPEQASVDLVKLDVQRASTLEIGGEGRHVFDNTSTLHWSLSLYHSDVEDELISSTDALGIQVGTWNYIGGTRHRGIEAGVDGRVAFTAADIAVDYRVAWTLSDFRFKGGEFAGNRIAGIPQQVWSAEWMFATGNWRLGPNLRWLPKATPTDHANSPGVWQDPYTLLGARLEYVRDGWRMWLLADNLGDRRYASSFAIRNQANVNQPTFLPGNGRSIGIGLRYQL
ncbi:MAG TPA: TonB-dependent receptor [Rhodanobacteraceae bacterium]|nr:TonB-dependent receptor [Rhodanobacteraceae bacterium]